MSCSKETYGKKEYSSHQVPKRENYSHQKEMNTTQLVNPAVLSRAQQVDYAVSHRSGARESYTVKVVKSEPYRTLPAQQSTTPAYATHQEPTSQVDIRSISRKTDPHLGSNEYYSNKVTGVQILRKYNNIFITRIPS